MIVGFSRHSKGAGNGPVRYLVDQNREGRTLSIPRVISGYSRTTEALIDSLDFEHTYTSGVLSFAPGEIITPEMEKAIIKRFEQIAFAGLEKEQYNILWVRHSHTDHPELHFVTPRVELTTGKSLNIRPPGDKTKAHFDDFRSEINALYGLADPDDPDRARTVSIPNHELKIAKQALRTGKENPENIRQIIDNVLTTRAVAGLITNRETLLEQAKELGFEVPRAGKDYITLLDPQSSQRIRMKGPLYERDYTPSRTLEKAAEPRHRDYSKPDTDAAQRFSDQVERHIAARAAYHRQRYPTPNQEHHLESHQQSHSVAHPDRGESLSGYLDRRLGVDSCLRESDSRHAERFGPAQKRGGTDPNIELPDPSGQNNVLHQNRRGEGPIHRREQQRVDDSKTKVETDDDRTRTPLAEHLAELRKQFQRAAQEFQQRTRDFRKRIQKHFAHATGLANLFRKDLQRPSTLARASDHLEQSSQSLNRILEPKLNKHKERTRGRKGPSLGR